MAMSLQQIDDYIAALRKNAAQLIEEAKVLHGVQAYARAYALAHFAREELSKAGMLAATGARLLAGHPVDWKMLNARMRDHKAKLRLENIEMAFLMKGAGHEDQARELMSGGAIAVAEVRNDSKNNALYVGFADGRVTMPSDTRTEYQSLRTIELAEMRYVDFEFRCKSLGPFAARQVGSLTMPVWDGRNPDESTLDFAARATVFIAKLAEASAETPQGHERRVVDDVPPSCGTADKL
jgi:AbiV family abortive infection protein